MQTVTAQDVKEFAKAAATFRKEIRQDSAKAKAFLIRAGIARKIKKTASRLELVPQLRSSK